MSTYKSKKRALLAFRIFRKGDHVSLVKNPIYRGVVEEYVGPQITPEARGRVFRVKWKGPTVAVSSHYDFELMATPSKLQLKRRPAEEKLVQS